MKKRIQIKYCTQCKWLLRASWMAQELLSTFEKELEEVALVPAESGTFEITGPNEALIWSRVRDGGFPDIKTLKTRVRDLVAPAKDLGHIEP